MLDDSALGVFAHIASVVGAEHVDDDDLVGERNAGKAIYDEVAGILGRDRDRQGFAVAAHARTPAYGAKTRSRRLLFESLDHACSRSFGDHGAQIWILEQTENHCCPRARFPRRDEEAGLSVLDQLGRAAHARRDHRHPGSHPLDHDAPERLGPGWHEQHVQRLECGGHVLGLTGELDRILDPEVCGQAREVGPIPLVVEPDPVAAEHHGTDDPQPRFRKSLADLREHADRIVLALPRRDLPDHPQAGRSARIRGSGNRQI